MFIDSQIVDSVISILTKKYKCHTAILYGSMARGDYTENSDIDILGIRTQKKKDHDETKIGSHLLDAFIINEQDILMNPLEYLHAKDGVVLFEQNEIGTKLLNRIRKCYRKGPAKMPDFKKRILKHWCDKMITRIRAKGVPHADRISID